MDRPQTSHGCAPLAPCLLLRGSVTPVPHLHRHHKSLCAYTSSRQRSTPTPNRPGPSAASTPRCIRFKPRAQPPPGSRHVDEEVLTPQEVMDLLVGIGVRTGAKRLSRRRMASREVAGHLVGDVPLPHRRLPPSDLQRHPVIQGLRRLLRADAAVP